MKIELAHLYPDMMNLYGEIGNIEAMQKYFMNQRIKVNVTNLTLEDKLDLEKYDVIYIGSGTIDNEYKVLKHMLKYNKSFKKAIDSNKFILATGSSIELFGKFIKDNDLEIEGLGVFDYYTLRSKSVVCETLGHGDLIKKDILGFQNRLGKIYDIEKYNPFLTITNGFGSNDDIKTEGIVYNNFIGTYIIGPILARNPDMLKYWCNSIIKMKYPNFKIKNDSLKLENKAYSEFIKFLYK